MLNVGSLRLILSSLFVGTLLVEAACTPEASLGADDKDLEEAGDGSNVDDGRPKPDLPVPTFKSFNYGCKLISNLRLDDPTANRTHFRANLRGTDLGIPVAHDDQLYFFFGDTAGYRGIWALGPESLPDAVGKISYKAVKDDPLSLCTDLRFLAAGSNVGQSKDSAIEEDFAVAYMTPPAGHDISEFIHNPSGPRGAGRHKNMPGDFEVPSGAFSHAGSIYLYYTTVVSPNVVEMKGSYLAKWKAPSPAGKPEYDILYHVDQRFDGNGALRGDFINIVPLVVGDNLYLYGTGEYRKSDIHVARKPLASLETEGGYQRFDARTKTWVEPREGNTKPIVDSPGVGELSVRYFANIGRYVMLNQEIAGNNNRIAARFATAPEGPWSEPIQVASMSDARFQSDYMCAGIDNCVGKQLFHRGRAGYYGTYMLPDARKNDDGSFTIHFTMSTWEPYNVALMSATFK